MHFSYAVLLSIASAIPYTKVEAGAFGATAIGSSGLLLGSPWGWKGMLGFGLAGAALGSAAGVKSMEHSNKNN